MSTPQIIVKAMCLFMYEDKLLLSKHRHTETGKQYYRPLGGGMEFQETSEETIRREIQEELGTAICDLVFVDVLENIFEYKGEKAHQIIFIYRANFVDTTMYQKNPIPFLEADLAVHEAEWIGRKEIQECWLVPDGIKTCIKKAYD